MAFFSEYMNFIEEFVSLSPLFSIRIYLGLYVFVFDQILTKFGKILRIALGRKNVGFLFFSKLETRTLHLFYSRIYSSPLTYAIIVFPKIIAVNTTHSLAWNSLCQGLFYVYSKCPALFQNSVAAKIGLSGFDLCSKCPNFAIESKTRLKRIESKTARKCS